MNQETDKELAAFKASLGGNLGIDDGMIDRTAAYLRELKPNADEYLAAVNEQLTTSGSNLAKMDWRDMGLLLLLHRHSCFKNHSERKGEWVEGDCPRSRYVGFRAAEHRISGIIRFDWKHVQYGLKLLAALSVTRKVTDKAPGKAERWAVPKQRPYAASNADNGGGGGSSVG